MDSRNLRLHDDSRDKDMVEESYGASWDITLTYLSSRVGPWSLSHIIANRGCRSFLTLSMSVSRLLNHDEVKIIGSTAPAERCRPPMQLPNMNRPVEQERAIQQTASRLPQRRILGRFFPCAQR